MTSSPSSSQAAAVAAPGETGTSGFEDSVGIRSFRSIDGHNTLEKTSTVSGPGSKHSILLPKECQQKDELLPIRIIATDFDGTLMGDQLEVPSSTIDTYRKIKNDPRIQVILATGRNLGGVRLALKESSVAREFQLNFFPGVYLNGSVIYGPGGETDVIANHSLEREKVVEIIRLVHSVATGTGPIELGTTVATTQTWDDEYMHDGARRVGSEIVCSEDPNSRCGTTVNPPPRLSDAAHISPQLAQLIRDSTGMASLSPAAGLPLIERTPLTVIILTKDSLCFDSINDLVANYAVLKVGPLHYVPSLEVFVRESPEPVNLMVLLAQSCPIIDKVAPCVHDLLGDCYDIGRLAPKALYISPRNVNKGTAMVALGKYLGVPMSDILGIGDADNDLELLRMCGVGVAMGNGSVKVKKAADFTTDCLESDGWTKAIAIGTSMTRLKDQLFMKMKEHYPKIAALGPRVRMIATDIDGTVFATGLSLPRTTVLALRRAARLGVPVVPATGRSYSGVVSVLNMLGYQYPEHFGSSNDVTQQHSRDEWSAPLQLWPGIYLNGCVVLGPNGRNDIVAEHLLPTEVVLKLADVVDDIESNVTQDPNWQTLPEVSEAETVHGFAPVCNPQLKPSYMTLACYSYGKVLISDETQLSDGSAQFRDGDSEVVGDLRRAIAARPVHKAIILSHSGASIQRFRPKIEEALRGCNIAMVSALPRCLEIMPSGISKATGLQELSKCLGISLDAIASFGDSDNDIEMLRECGFSVAMGNSSVAVKEAAAVTAADVGKQGWAITVNALLDQIEQSTNTRSSCSTVPSPSNPATFNESP